MPFAATPPLSREQINAVLNSIAKPPADIPEAVAAEALTATAFSLVQWCNPLHVAAAVEVVSA